MTTQRLGIDVVVEGGARTVAELERIRRAGDRVTQGLSAAARQQTGFTVGERLTRGMSEAARAAERVQRNVAAIRVPQQAVAGVDRLQQSLTSLQRLGGIALGFVGVQQAASSAIRLADNYARLTATLRNATTTQAEYSQGLADVQRIADAAQADIGAVGQLYGKLNIALAEAGRSQAEVAQITESVAQALRASGASANEAQSAILQLSQAFGSGVLRGEEFNAVFEAAPNILRAVAESLGVPVGALREMAAAGQLTSDVVGNALIRSLEGFRAQGANVQTVGGAFVRLSNAVQVAAGQFDQTTGLSRALSGVLVAVAQNLQGIAVAAGTAAAALAINFARSATVLAGVRTAALAIPALFAGPAGIAAAVAIAAGAFVSFGAQAEEALDGVIRKQRELLANADTAQIRETADDLRRQRAEVEGRLQGLAATGVDPFALAPLERELDEIDRRLRAVREIEIERQGPHRGNAVPGLAQRNVGGGGITLQGGIGAVDPERRAQAAAERQREAQERLREEEQFAQEQTRIAERALAEQQRLREQDSRLREQERADELQREYERIRAQDALRQSLETPREGAVRQLRAAQLAAGGDVELLRRAYADIIDDLDAQTEGWRDVQREVVETNRAAQELGFLFSSAFEDAIVGARGLGEVMQGIGTDIARILVRRNITEPFAQAVSSLDLGSIFGSFFGGARSAGGPVAGGRAYLVGERGPELFVPGASGAIVPNGAGGVVVNVINQSGGQVSASQSVGADGQTQIDVLVASAERRIAHNVAAGRSPIGSVLERRYGLSSAAGTLSRR